MNYRALVLITSLLALPVTARAQTASGLYVSAGAGINFMQEEDVDAQLAASPSTHIAGEVTTNPGPALVGALGWRSARGVRVEVEGNYRSNAIDSIGAAFTGADGLSGDAAIGAEKKYGAMVNALYEIRGQRIAPYFGGGIGGQFVHEPAVNSTSAGGVAVAVAATTTGTLAYQLIAGTAFPIHRNNGISITAEYRLMSLVGARESTATVTIPGLGVIEVIDSSSHDRNHAVLFGIRYVFGG